jgi:hypothetical protein
MSALIEGGGEFIDYRDPDNIFRTKDPAEWDQHLKDTKATISGTAPCAICSNEVTFEDVTYGTKPVCDSCKGNLVGQ